MMPQGSLRFRRSFAPFLLAICAGCASEDSADSETNAGATASTDPSNTGAENPSGTDPTGTNGTPTPGSPGTDTTPSDPMNPVPTPTTPAVPDPTDPSTPTPGSGGAPVANGGTGGSNAEGGAGDGGADNEPSPVDAGGTGGNPEPEGEAGSVSDGGSAGAGGEDLPPFSFFVTSYAAIARLSGSPDGFGGDLRYGEETGLEGADKICTEIAEASMPGSSAKGWRAFLSVVNGPGGGQVDAIDRIGEGPWYDRAGRVVGMTIQDLQQTRPNADPQIAEDLPNEDGIGNHAPDGEPIDNHHVLTGSDAEGRLYGNMATCADWTSTEMSADGRPRIGFSWPAGGRENWISGQDEGGCLVGIDIDGGGGSDPSVGTVGSGGGYGGIYCFALTP